MRVRRHRSFDLGKYSLLQLGRMQGMPSVQEKGTSFTMFWVFTR